MRAKKEGVEEEDLSKEDREGPVDFSDLRGQPQSSVYGSVHAVHHPSMLVPIATYAETSSGAYVICTTSSHRYMYMHVHVMYRI